MVFTFKENLLAFLQGKRIAVAVLLFLSVIVQTALLWGQEAAKGPSLGGKEITPIPLNPLAGQDVPLRVKRDIIYMPDSEGNIRPVPLDVTMEKYLDWLDREDSAAQSGLPTSVIENLSCRGHIQYSANRTPWAFISCQMEIETQNSPQWQFLLLDMKEATLAGMVEQNRPAKSEGLLLTREGKENQWILWYRNRKQINLTINVLVPIQVVGDQRQLTLSLPTASRTELQLQLDRKDVKLDLKSKGFDAVEQNEKGTLITIKGFNQLVDFLWSPMTKQSNMPAEFHVDSQIYVTRTSDSTTIDATQNITLQRGTLDRLKIRIPSPFNIDSINSDQKYEYSIGTDRSLITLIFQKPIEKSVQIDWKLTAPIRKFEAELLLDGFDVLGAKTQTGKIAILNSNDWRIGQIPSKTKNVYQMNVRQIAREGKYSQAFQFYGQPWLLALVTQRTQARYSLETFYNLKARSDSLQLTVDFEITPRNGAVDAVQLQWPEFTSDQWTIEEIVQGSSGLSIKWSLDGKLELPNWDKKDTIRLVASRKIEKKPAEVAGKKSKLPFSLPRISTSDSHIGQQVLRITSDAGPYELVLSGDGFEKLTDEEISPDILAREIYNSAKVRFTRQSWYHITNAKQKISFAFAEIIRKIRCESEVQIHRIISSQKKVVYRQVLKYSISELAAKQLIVRIPQIPVHADVVSVDREIRFLDEAGNTLETRSYSNLPSDLSELDSEVSAQAEESASAPDKYLVIKLPHPVLGEYTLIIQGEFPLESLAKARNFKTAIPVYLPYQADHFQLKFSNHSAYKIEPLGNGWVLQLSENNYPAKHLIPIWKGESSTQKIPLEIDMSKSRLDEQIGVVEGRVSTWISSQGKVISEMVFDLTRVPPVFNLKDVKDFEIVSVNCYWEKGSKTKQENLTAEQNENGISFLLPEQAVGHSGKLVVKIMQTKNSMNLFGKISLAVPDHSLSKQIAWLQWRIHFPDGTYLYSPPGNLSANYSWQWKNWGFRRVNNSAEELISETSMNSVLKPSKNSYSFTSVGWPDKIEVRCIGRGLLMAFGTGMPLIIAVFFTGRHRDQKLRGALLLFAITGAAIVQFPEQMALLAQPALIGVFFTLLATWVAGKLRSYHEDPTLIIIGPSHTQGDENNAEPGVSFHGTAGDEITRIQPPRVSSLESSR